MMVIPTEIYSQELDSLQSTGEKIISRIARGRVIGIVSVTDEDILANDYLYHREI